MILLLSMYVQFGHVKSSVRIASYILCEFGGFENVLCDAGIPSTDVRQNISGHDQSCHVSSLLNGL